ncbi:hypothetical protein DOY81_007706 [Sarcophaga bullata]|nr:hypothetical protein DOY81_007706 [Sarcophaga bullata]
MVHEASAVNVTNKILLGFMARKEFPAYKHCPLKLHEVVIFVVFRNQCFCMMLKPLLTIVATFLLG